MNFDAQRSLNAAAGWFVYRKDGRAFKLRFDTHFLAFGYPVCALHVVPADFKRGSRGQVLSPSVDVDAVGVSDKQSVAGQTQSRRSIFRAVDDGGRGSELGVEVQDAAVVAVGDEAAASVAVQDDVPRIVETLNAVAASSRAERPQRRAVSTHLQRLIYKLSTN